MKTTDQIYSSSNQHRYPAPLGRIILIFLFLVVVGPFCPAVTFADIQQGETQAANPAGEKMAPGAVAATENTPPVAVADSATLSRNTSVAINVLANDYDPDANTTAAGQIDPASVTITSRPRSGARLMVSETGMVTYAPKRNFRGFDSFSYTVKDTEGAVSKPAKVTITVKDPLKERLMTGGRQ